MTVSRRLLGCALALVIVVGCRDGAPDEYTDETRAVFLRSCAEPAAGQGLAEAVCRCAYSQIVATIPFEEFEDLEAALDEDPPEEPEDVPDEIADIYAACAAAGLGTTTTTLPTTSTSAAGD